MDGAELFNPIGLFPNDCVEQFLGPFDGTGSFNFTGLVPGKVTRDSVSLFKTLSGVLPNGTSYYVNARRPSPTNFSSIYPYETDNTEDLALSHFVTSREGDCLTFSSSSGSFESMGVDCNSKQLPLCFRSPPSDSASTSITSLCASCAAGNFCKVWTNLQDFTVDGVTITGAEVCTDVCYSDPRDCSKLGSDSNLFNLKSFVQNGNEAVQYLSAQVVDNSTYGITGGGTGAVQKVVASALASHAAMQYFHVDLNVTISTPAPRKKQRQTTNLDGFGQWGDVSENKLDILQTIDVKNNLSDECGLMKADNNALQYQSSNCTASFPPLCMRGTNILVTGAGTGGAVRRRKQKPKNKKKELLRWKQKRNKRRKVTGFSNRLGQSTKYNKDARETVKERWSADKNVAVEYAGKGRQLQSGGMPYDMCLLATPVVAILSVIGTFSGTPAADAQVVPQPPPQQQLPPQQPPPQQTTQQTLEELNPTQDFNTFQNSYQKVYSSLAEQQFRQTVFLQSLQIVNTHNLLYIAGQASYFVAINSFSDLTYNEFVASFTGVGLFKPLANLTNPVPADFQSRGSLPTNPQPPLSVDFSQSVCKSRIRNQICNSCSAQSAISAVEYCLCLAGENNLQPRSIQQISECTDSLGLDVGSQLERVNQHCITGFPDVHLSYIVGSLNGTVETEELLPESEEKFPCINDVQEPTTARVVDYISDYFTTEDYLLDSLSSIGPTSTNIAVTPMLQFFAGGIYYNPEECDDYTQEIVPPECQETRGGRATYTCLEVNGVNCAELLPYHCDLFFKQKDDVYSHSVTAVGYGQDTDGTQFWRLKNSWGEEWGEGGYIRFAKGLGHCSIGTFYALPQCSL